MQTTMIPVLTEVTEEVFETMVFSPVKALPPCDALPNPFGAGIIATISFTGTTTNGVVSFYAPMSAARTIAAAMLGLSPEELQDEVPDAIGELTNMIAGAFRTRMADDQGAWAISTPNVALGSDLSVRHVGATARMVCPFELGSDRLFVELVLTDPSRVSLPERHEARSC